MSEANATPTNGAGPTTDDVPNELVRSIHIDADARTVWDIVSEPGWFINDGEYRAHAITAEESARGSVSRVVDPVYGEFVIETVALDPPRRAEFRWLAGEPGQPAEGALDNTVVFTVEPDADGPGVTLTVRESGFAAMSKDTAARRRAFEENTKGWIEELALLRRLAESRGGVS